MAFYQNRLPFVRDILLNEPNNAFIFKFMADPPTTTLQRIKGLTTGGLPTFIDVADNFDPTQSIKEDNIIDQLLSQGKKIYFMGDDTWTSVFPGKFTRAHAYPSLVVKDLHTVDNGVIEHIFPYLKGERGSWDVLLGHFLGVDHVGHVFGSDHPAMAPKLDQMNRVLEQMKALLDNETLFILMGDHGMTLDGNHGGSSEQELSAGIFFYSKKGLNRGNHVFGKRSLSEEELPVIAQVDFPPTLSLLLGSAVPFGSLGQVVPDLFASWDLRTFNVSDKSSEDLLRSLRRLSAVRFLNAAQMLTYLKHYSSKTRQFPEAFIAELTRRFEDLRQRFAHSSDFDQSFESLNEFQSAFTHFHSYGIEMCHRLWTSFDEPRMVEGVFLIALSLGIIAKDSSRMPLVLTPTAASVSLGILSFLLGLEEDALFIAWISWALLFLGVNYKQISLVDKLRSINFPMASSFVLVSLRVAALLTNSYIEAEEKMLHFLATTVLALSLLSKTAPKSQSLWVIAAVVLMRLLTSATGGRHETIINPEAGSFLSELISPIFVLGLVSFLQNSRFTPPDPLQILAFLITIATRYLSLSSVSLGFEFICAFLSFLSASNLRRPNDAPTLSLWSSLRSNRILLAQGLLMGLYWVGSSSGINGDLHTPGWVPFLFRIAFPQTVFVLALLRLAASVMEPKNRALEMLISISPFLILILGRRSLYGFTLLITLARALLSREMDSSYSALFLTLLSDQFFYKTGHKPDFSALHFQSPYVGFDHYNFVLGGFILISNTFAGQIAACLILGALIASTVASKDSKSTLLFRFLFFSTAKLLFSMLSAGVQRRHLMVWRLFAPKYVFDGSMILVTDLVLLIVTMFLL